MSFGGVYRPLASHLAHCPRPLSLALGLVVTLVWFVCGFDSKMNHSKLHITLHFQSVRTMWTFLFLSLSPSASQWISVNANFQVENRETCVQQHKQFDIYLCVCSLFAVHLKRFTCARVQTHIKSKHKIIIIIIDFMDVNFRFCVIQYSLESICHRLQWF